MSSLNITATGITPAVDLDPENATLTLKGECYPEDPSVFFEPIKASLKTFLSTADTLNIILELHYFNTSSSKALLDLLEVAEAAYLKGKQVRATWRYHEGVEIMQENGEDFADDLKLPFELVAFTPR